MGKWTSRILIMLIVVIAADVNCNARMKQSVGTQNVLVTDLILVALIGAIYLISKLKKRP